MQCIAIGGMMEISRLGHTAEFGMNKTLHDYRLTVYRQENWKVRLQADLHK